MKQIDFSNGIDVQEFFDEIVNSMKGVKIASIFSLCPSFSNHGNVREYMEDTEIYILFANEKCLVVDYRFIDSLKVTLRTLSGKEKTWYEDTPLKDFFNDSTNIHNMTSDNQTILVRNFQ